MKKKLLKLKINQQWKKAKQLIPGGTQLLSKGSERFLPEYWPAYFKRAKGVMITDMENNTYIDMSIMSVGSCTLGYADADVNRAVKKVIDAGSMATLNSPEEIALAEVLTKMHPWADMVRYARTGGEACAIAVRIGRAYTKKDTVAFCGYHGWSDWYLSTNLSNDKHLDGQLLPGLKPSGVPRGLKGSAIPFQYNHIEELEKIVRKHKVGVIIMEPIRHQEQKNNFLKKVRAIADRVGAVLIFDEVSAGFRLTVGGSHLLYGVNPDIAVFGKAMSNGYPMSAVIGRKKIMDIAQESFISSTYWSERIGPTAALATIKKMKAKNVPQYLVKIGNVIGAGWKKLAQKHGLNIEVHGPYSLVNFKFLYPEPLVLKTLFTQEMLKRGFLASLGVYVSYSHQQKHVRSYLESVDEVFGIIAHAIKNKNAHTLLKGPVAHSDFRRLT
ncbi:MAG: aminotransferase class III-fold pyridoxal phosphate-dependent enzyme [bacterium]|nr:aminotransferase class III-fold pyridoxal phosphate-dependent enzyme [bacterium]